MVRPQALTPSATIMEASQALTPQATFLEDRCRGAIMEAPQATILWVSQALIPPGSIMVRPRALNPTTTIVEGSQALTPQVTIREDCRRGAIKEGPKKLRLWLRFLQVRLWGAFKL